MSFVSVMPFGDTLDYWWAKLAGDNDRYRFIALKLVEVTAFIGNYFRNRSRSKAVPRKQFAWTRPPNRVSDGAKVIVVVPALIRNSVEERRVNALVEALRKQSHACHMLLVDDGSPPWRMPQLAEVLALPRNVGPAAARNHGIRRALELNAEVIAFTDADCIPDQEWVAELVAAFRTNRRAHAVSGATRSVDQSFLGRYHERNGTLNGRKLEGESRLLYGPSCNLAVTAELAACIKFDEAFPEAAAEDIEFCFRANEGGWTIDHASSAVVSHDYGYDGAGITGSIARFWRQFRRYARGERLLLEKHPTYFAAFKGSSEIAVTTTPSE